MRILMVSSYLPYPLYSGGNIRLYNLLKFLSKNHKITLVCEKRPFQSEEDVREVEKICHKVITVERKKQWSAKNIVMTGFSLNPFLITGHTNKTMTKIIAEEIAKEKYDLIHVETFYVMQNLPVTSIPVVLVEHNIEYLVYKRFADKAKFFVRPLLYADVLKLKKKEEYFWERANKLIAVSNAEKDMMTRKDTEVVPNGVDLGKFEFQVSESKFKDEEKRILFIGDFRWIQNQDCATFIIKDIWPKLIANKQISKMQMGNGKLKLWIVGKNMSRSIKGLTNDDNVIFDDENQMETEEIYRRSFLLLAPIRVGGGTSYKILEAMASGTAVVTTNLGMTGLEIRNNKEVLSAETPGKLAESVADFLTDKNLYGRIAKSAREFVEENYDWNKISKDLEKVYASILKE